MMSPLPLSPYSLDCSVCGGEFRSKSEWLQHLTTESHQVLAREECLEEWEKKEVRDCCLVVFSSFPLTGTSAVGGGGGGNGGADKVIQYFSKDVRTIVTDFVCFEERPYLGVVQFESRKKAREVVSTFKDHKEERLINNEDRIQVRLASDLLRLEWNSVLPRSGVRSAASDRSISVPPLPSSRSSRRKSTTDKSSHYINSTPQQTFNNNEDGQFGGNSVLEEDEQQPSFSEDHQIPPRTSAAKSKEKCPFLRLNELTEHHKWEHPKFILTSKPDDLKFRYTVAVNGVEYRSSYGGTTKAKAKTSAAYHCLRRLRKYWIGGNTLEETGNSVLEESCQGKRLLSSPEENVAEPPIKKRKVTDEKPEKKPFHFGSLPTSPPSEQDSLQYQFWIVRKAVTISDVDYGKAIETVRVLKSLFSMKDSTTQIEMFRNGHIKLKRPISRGNNDLLLYIYLARSQPEFPSSFTWLPDSLIAQVLDGDMGFTVLEAIDPCNNDVTSKNKLMGWKVQHKRTSQIFQLITYKRFFMEVQICRLLEYMISFDPRCHSLLTLAYFWSSVNSYLFGEVDLNGKNAHLSLPEPLALEWMVMTYLCHRKLVPSPREIQAKPHQILKDRLTGVDVGFAADPKFAQKWRARFRKNDPTIPKKEDHSSEEFIESVLELFYEFLMFFGGTLESGNWILNTRDGEVISTEDFLSSDPGAEGEASWSTKMTAEELASLRSLQGLEKDNEGDVGIKYKVNFEHRKIYMIHPFVFSCKFAVSSRFPFVLRKMKTCAGRLEKFMKIRSNNGVAAAKKRFGALEDVLKLQ